MSNLSPNLADKKRNLSDVEESVEPVLIKKYKGQLIIKAKPDVHLKREQVGFRSDSPNPQGQEGLYDPDEDLWLQWHTDGIKNPKKRNLFI